MTPDEGSRWFSALGGVSSVVCGLMGYMIPFMVPRVGLYGLMAATSLVLCLCLLCSDRAYALSQKYDFDPSLQMKAKQLSEAKKSEETKHRLGKALDLFRRVPTLGALFGEVLSWQSLNTILGLAFVTAIKANFLDDLERSAYFGRFYTYVNGVSAILQFIVMPFFMKFAEPKWIWRVMPVIPLVVCFIQIIQPDISLTLLASAVFLAKVTDYSVRSVVYVMAYQPLDYESRYVGKEIVGVIGSRIGKSGMSLLISGWTALGWASVPGFCQLSFCTVACWQVSTIWLSSFLPTQKEAQIAAEKDRREQQVKSQ